MLAATVDAWIDRAMDGWIEEKGMSGLKPNGWIGGQRDRRVGGWTYGLMEKGMGKTNEWKVMDGQAKKGL